MTPETSSAALSAPILRVTEILRKAQGGYGYIGFSAAIEKAIASRLSLLPRISPSDIQTLIAALEVHNDDLCSRFSNEAFITIVAILKAAETSWAQGRGLYLLAHSLHNLKKPQSNDEISFRATRKSVIGAQVLSSLLRYFGDDHRSEDGRRWIGVLCGELLEGCDENKSVLETGNEEIRRALGRVVTSDPSQVLRLLAGIMIRCMIVYGSPADIFWPIGTDQKTFAAFPSSRDVPSQWVEAFESYLDHLNSQNMYTTEMTDMYFASAVWIGDVEYLSEQSTILATLSNSLNIIVPSSAEDMPTFIDIPIHNVASVTIRELTEGIQANTGHSPDKAKLVIGLRPPPNQMIYINAAECLSGALYLTFAESQDAYDFGEWITAEQAIHLSQDHTDPQEFPMSQPTNHARASEANTLTQKAAGKGPDSRIATSGGEDCSMNEHDLLNEEALIQAPERDLTPPGDLIPEIGTPIRISQFIDDEFALTLGRNNLLENAASNPAHSEKELSTVQSAKNLATAPQFPQVLAAKSAAEDSIDLDSLIDYNSLYDASPRQPTASKDGFKSMTSHDPPQNKSSKASQIRSISVATEPFDVTCNVPIERIYHHDVASQAQHQEKAENKFQYENKAETAGEANKIESSKAKDNNKESNALYDAPHSSSKPVEDKNPLNEVPLIQELAHKRTRLPKRRDLSPTISRLLPNAKQPDRGGKTAKKSSERPIEVFNTSITGHVDWEEDLKTAEEPVPAQPRKQAQGRKPKLNAKIAKKRPTKKQETRNTEKPSKTSASNKMLIKPSSTKSQRAPMALSAPRSRRAAALRANKRIQGLADDEELSGAEAGQQNPRSNLLEQDICEGNKAAIDKSVAEQLTPVQKTFSSVKDHSSRVTDPTSIENIYEKNDIASAEGMKKGRDSKSAQAFGHTSIAAQPQGATTFYAGETESSDHCKKLFKESSCFDLVSKESAGVDDDTVGERSKPVNLQTTYAPENQVTNYQEFPQNKSISIDHQQDQSKLGVAESTTNERAGAEKVPVEKPSIENEEVSAASGKSNIKPAAEPNTSFAQKLKGALFEVIESQDTMVKQSNKATSGGRDAEYRPPNKGLRHDNYVIPMQAEAHVKMSKARIYPHETIQGSTSRKSMLRSLEPSKETSNDAWASNQERRVYDPRKGTWAAQKLPAIETSEIIDISSGCEQSSEYISEASEKGGDKSNRKLLENAPCKRSIEDVEKSPAAKKISNQVHVAKRLVTPSRRTQPNLVPPSRASPITNDQLYRKPAVIEFTAKGPMNQGVVFTKKRQPPPAYDSVKLPLLEPASESKTLKRKAIEEETADKVALAELSAEKRRKVQLEAIPQRRQVSQNIIRKIGRHSIEHPRKQSSQSTRVDENGSPISLMRRANPQNTWASKVLQNFQTPEEDFTSSSSKNSRINATIDNILPSLPEMQHSDCDEDERVPFSDRKLKPRPSSPTAPSKSLMEFKAHQVHGKDFVDLKTNGVIKATWPKDPFTGRVPIGHESGPFMERLKSTARPVDKSAPKANRHLGPISSNFRVAPLPQIDPDETLVDLDAEQDPPSQAPISRSPSPYSSDLSGLSKSSSDANVDTATKRWCGALKPHQSSQLSVLYDISNRLLRHFIDKETAVNNIVEEYQAGGMKLINSIEKKYRQEYEKGIAKIDILALERAAKYQVALDKLARYRKRLKKNPVAGLERQLRADQERIQAAIEAAKLLCL